MPMAFLWKRAGQGPAGLVVPALGAAAALLLAEPQPAHAQRVVPKIGDICPLGYVDMLNGKCSTLGLMTYTVQPTNGQACPEGWMNVGGGYCRRK
jgi:hypothetical protein